MSMVSQVVQLTFPASCVSRGNVALLLGCCCLMLVALLSRGRHGLRSSPRDLVELVEGCDLDALALGMTRPPCLGAKPCDSYDVQ